MNYKTLFTNYRTTVSQLLLLVLPILAAHQIGAFIPLFNNRLAGWHSPLWLAATGLANTVFTAIMGFGWGIITSVGILTAKQLGKNGDTTQTGTILKASLLTTLILTVPIMALLRNMEPIWLFFGQAPEISRLGQEYLNGFLWIVFVDLAKFGVFQFAIAHHHVTGPLVATAISIPLILLISITLVPYYGIYGLGLGTAIAYWIIFIALWAYCYKDRVFSRCFSVKAPFKTYLTLALKQFKVGIPIGAMSTIELLFFVIIGFWAGRISIAHLIAHQIAMQWLCFTIMGTVSFSEAITILIAKAYVQNNLRSTTRFLRAGVWLSAISMTLVSTLYWTLPHFLIRWSLPNSNDLTIMQISVSTLALCGIFQIVDGVRIALSGVLRGLSDTQYPMWVTLFAFWGIGLPISYICTFILKWEQNGLWLGMTCAVIAMIGLQYARMQKLLDQADTRDNSLEL